MSGRKFNLLFVGCAFFSALFAFVFLLSLFVPVVIYHEQSDAGLVKIWSENGGLQICRITGPQVVISISAGSPGEEPATIGLDLSEPHARWVHFNVRISREVHSPPRYDANVQVQRVAIGWGLGLFVFGVPAFLMWMRQLQRSQRQAKRLCPNCGYDLRATPDRCPECGRAADAV